MKKFYIVISCILFSRIIAAQPNISVSPASFNVTIANCNDSVTQTLTINNTGNATLNYTLSQDNIPLGIPYHYGYICNAGSNTVSVINLKTNTLVGSPIAVGTFPWRVTISPDARFAYVSNRNSNNISVIRTSDNTVVATIAVGGQTSGIAVTPDSRYAYVGDRSYSDVKKIDCITNQVIDTIFSFDLSDPQDIAITPDGTKAYVCTQNSGVTVIDLTADTILANIPGANGAHSVAITPDGTKAYVTESWTNNVLVISTSSNTVIKTFTGFDQPHGIDITKDGKRAYFLDKYNDKVVFINVSNDSIIGNVSDSRFNNGWDLILSSDEKFAFVSNPFPSNSNDDVVITDLVAKTVTGTLSTGSGTRGMYSLEEIIGDFATFTPDSGGVSASSSTNISVKFNALGMLAGTYIANINVNSNDPSNPLVIIPCTMTVTGTAEIAYTGVEIISGKPYVKYDTVLVGVTKTDTVFIKNNSCKPLTVTDMDKTLSQFVVSDSVFTVPPYDSVAVYISFSPTSPVEYLDSLIVYNNDNDTLIYLHGYGNPPPVISVSPTSFNVTINGCADTVNQTMKVYNTGASNLYYNLTNVSGYDSTSQIIFTGSDATTNHVFNNLLYTDSLYVTVTINGDFDSGSEYCEVYIDGDYIELIPDGDPSNGIDIVRNYAFGGSQVVNWMSDGKITVTLDNSPNVDAFVGTEIHRVRIYWNGVGWLDVSPLADTVSVGDSSIVNMQFSSTNYVNGVYTVNMLVNSNDPANPTISVPCTLTVNGTPLMELTKNCINYDTVMVTTNKTDSLYIKNTGCDTLKITNITKQTAEYSISNTSYTILPWDSAKLVITFAPTSAGTKNDTLKIFSNAGDSLICLKGIAIPPPVISVNPSGFNVTINSCNDSVTQPLKIYNTGGSNLNYGISGFNNTPVSACNVTTTGYCCSMGIYNVTFNTINNNSANGSAGYQNFTSINTTVASGATYTLSVQTGTSYAENVRVWIDWNNNGVFEVSELVMVSTNTLPTVIHTTNVAIPTNAVRNTALRMRVGSDYSLNSAPQSCNNVQYGQFEDYTVFVDKFLSATPTSGTVIPADSATVSVKFKSTGLNNGVYTTFFTVNSNDPATPAVNVPCTLTVNGTPNMLLTKNCFNYDTVMVTVSKKDSLYIKNTGCDTLKITNITKQTAEFSISNTAYTLLPGDSGKLVITFAPTSSGTKNDTLKIFSNAGDSLICLKGIAIPPPTILVVPSSFNVNLACDDSIAQTIKIYNTGNSNLNFTAKADSARVFSGKPIGPLCTPQTTGTCCSMGIYNVTFNTINKTTGNATQGYQNYDSVKTVVYPGVTYLLSVRTGTGYAEKVRVWIDYNNNGVFEGTEQVMATQNTLPTVIHTANITIPLNTVKNKALRMRVGSDYAPNPAPQPCTNVQYGQFEDYTVFVTGLNYIATSGGTIVAGDSVVSTVSFTSNNLNAGIYNASFIFNSNDPANPLVNIPCTITVSGNPVMTLNKNCIDFDSIFVYTSKTDSIYIKNTGCDTLKISNITTQTSQYYPSTTLASILPGDSLKVKITFAPTVNGTQPDTLKIFSNAGDSLICLKGYSIPPPIISFNKDSIFATIGCNDSITDTLKIFNTGGADLTYSIAGSGYGLVGDTSILIIQESPEWGVDMQNFILTNYGKNSTKITSAQIASTNFMLYDIIITVGEENTTYYNNISANKTKFEAFLNNGGILQHQLANYNGITINLAGGVNATNGNNELYNTIAMPTHPIVTGLPNPLQGNDASAGYLQNLPGGTNTITTTQNSVVPTTIEYTYGKGVVVASTMTLGYLYNNNFNSKPMLPRITEYCMSKIGTIPKWITSINPIADTVPVSDSISVAVKISSDGLVIGTYTTNLIINSNDPLSSKDTVYVSLTVTGTPDFNTVLMDTAGTCLDLDSIMEYTTSVDSILFLNTGCDTLFIDSMTISNSVFTIVVADSMILPGDTGGVIIRFSPVSTGTFNSNLSIYTNELDTVICLTGKAYPRPIISFAPDTITATLNCADTIVLPLKIYNTGGSNLNYSIDTVDYYATFDGVNDYIRINNNYPGLNTVTLETWIYPTSISGARWLISNSRDCCTPGGFNLYINGSSLAGSIWRSAGNNLISTSSVSGTITLNEWQHVALVYDGTQIMLYRNGILVSTSATYASSSVLNGSQNLHFGVLAYLAPNYFDYQGNMDDIRIWNNTRTQAQIAATMNQKLMGNESGLWGYWNFETQNANDVTTYGNNGTLFGNTSIAQYPNNHIYTLSPISGPVVPTDSAITNITLISTGMLVGTYYDNIYISSNDPLSTYDTIPVVLTVVGAPDFNTVLMDTSGTCLDLDSIMEYTTSIDSISFLNTGCDTLFIDSMTISNSVFTIVVADSMILPGDTGGVIIRFSPVSTGTFNGNLSIYTNELDTVICLTGKAYPRPAISYSPDSISVTFACSDSLTDTIKVYNTGLSDLIYNTSFYSDSTNGKSLRIAGSGSPGYMTFKDSLIRNDVTLTVETWFKTSSNGGILGYQNTAYPTGPGNWVPILYVGSDGKLRGEFWYGSVNPITSSGAVNDSKWHHVALVGNTNTQSMYLDGVLVGSRSGNINHLGMIKNQLGVVYTSSWPSGNGGWYFFNGRIDEVRVFNYPKTLAQINATRNIELQGNETGLVGYWRFNDGTGNDFSPSNYNGTLQLNASISVPNAPVLPSWLNINLTTDTVPSNDSSLISYTLNSTGLLVGQYNVDLIFNSNDPLSPKDTIPVTMNVVGAPKMVISDTCLAFDTIMEYTSTTKDFFITNTGCDTLWVSVMTSTNFFIDSLSVDSAGGYIVPGDTADITAFFAPDSSGNFTGTITITSNDYDTTICLSGNAFPRPVILHLPDTINVTLACNDTLIDSLVVYNTGGSDLVFSMSYIGKSSVFDGVNDYISTPLNIDQGGGSPLTLEAWVYPTSNSAGRHQVISSDNGGFDWSILREGGNWYVFTGSGSTNTGFSVDLNQWQHLAAVFIPGTGVRFYKNGNLFSTSTISYDASDNNINLGRNPMNSEFFQGRIDEARVWNIQRSQAEIISTLNKKLTGNETGLRGYWNFDNETANDFSGNNYNGTLNNGASIGIPNAPVLEKWLNYSPVNADTIFASDSSKIPVTISSTGLGTGQYTTYMVLNSNDPLKPNDTVQVVLNVNGTPEIFLTKNCIYLDSIMEYTTSKDSLYVKNIGCDTLQITNITKQTSEFTINTTSATLAPGDSVKLVVIFAPTSVGTFNDTLKIFSNAGDSLICLSGKAFARPVVSAAPDTIKGIIASCQDSIDISLTIYNSGGSDLIWNITSTPANVNVIPFPSADTTASADSTLITVRLKDTGLSGGTYNYTIKINSNDPLTPVVNIPVILTVDTVLPSAPVASDTAICFGQTTPDLIAVGDSIRWYSDGALTTMVHSGDTFATGETSVGIYTYYVTQTLFSTGCQSIADTVVLQISTAPGQPTATDTTVCSDATIPSLSSTGTIRKWYADGTLTTLLFTGNPFSTGQTAPGSYNYYVTDSTAGCPASPADTSSLVINQAATVDAGISVDFICEGSPYTLSGSMGGSASTILWTTSGDGTFDDNTSLTATYTPGTTDISNGSVDLTITSNDPDGAGPCGQVSDLITITIMPAATADAGIDSVICEGSTYTLGGSFGGGASSASWTTSGTGTFNNASSLTATYTPSAADISAEAVKLYLTTNDPAGPCPAVTDSMMLTINLAAVVNAGADTAICTGQTYTLAGTKAGSTSTVSWTTSGDGTFDDNTLLAATYTPGATDISNGTVTLTITSNDPDGVGPCAAVADNMVLTINSTPAQPTGTDTTVCSDVTIPVLSATGTTRKWYADGSLTTLLFTGNPFNTGQTAAGVYTYYVTDSLPACPASDADTVVLTINQAATVNAGSNDTICEGNTYTLAGTMGGSASSITWSSSGDGTFDDNTLLAATYTPGATDISNGTVTLTITSNDPDGSGPCFAVVSSMILKINPEALVNAGIDSVICEGSTYTLAGIIGGSASSASWTSSGTGTFNNASSLTATYTPSAADISAGSVKLYLTTNDPAGPCPAVTDSMMLTINPAAVVNAGADTAICTGQTYTLVGTTAGSTSTVSWTTSGDGTFDDNTLLAATYTPGASDLSNGTVTLTITSNDPDGAGPCAAVVDNMVLTINSTPSTPLASDTAICFGQSTPNLIAGGTLVKWYSDPTLNTFVFSGNSYASGQTASGTYNYYVTDSVSGCPASDADTATLVINPLPAAPTANDTAICFGSPTPDLTATGDSVRWYSDGTLTTLVNNGNNFATGKTAVGSYIYYVTQTNLITGCQSAADTVTLTIKAIPSAPVSSDTASCEGSTVPDLTAAGTNIIWYSDGTLTTQVGAGNNYSTGQTASGTYFYYLTQTVNGCTGLSDTVSLVINAVPSVPIAPDTTVCQGQTVPDLTAAGSNVTWYSDSALTTQVGAGNSFTSGQTNPGSYSYFVTQTVNSCQSIGKKVTLTILPVPSAPVAADTSVCYGQTVPDLTASGTNLKWYSDAGLTTLVFSGNPFATGQTNVGNYTYYVTDSLNSCGQAPSTAVTLTIDTLPSAPAVSNVTVCEGDSVPPLSATGTSVKWYSDSDLTNLVFSGNPFNTGKTAPGIYDYYVTSSVAGCGEGAATKATLTINSLPSAPVAANDSACEGNIIPNLTASGTGIVWYSDSALTTQAGTGNSFNTGQTSAGVYSYYATQTDSVTGCQSLATKVTLTIKPVPSSPVANNQNAVEGGTIPDLTATGSNLEWYSDSALTVNVASGNTFTTGQTAAGVYTYYVTQSSNGCTSSATTVTLTIYPGAPTAADTSACFGQAVPELSASGSNIKWYSDSLATLVFTGNPYNTGQTAAGTYTYYVSQTVNGLESPGTAVTLTITTLPSAPVVSADTSVCQNQTNPAFNAAGTNIIWYSDAALSVNIGSGNSYTSPQATVGSYTYYATQNPAGCESSSDSVMLTINPAPGKPAGMDSSVCFGGTVPDLFATGSNINWYSDAGLTTLVNTGNTFNTGQTAAGTYNYYVTDSLNGCFSTSDTVTLLISTPSNAPTGAVSNIDSVCPGSNVVLYAQGTASTGTQWTWYNGSCGGLKIGAGDSITVSQSSTTTYFVRAEGGCDISACVNVTINVTKTTSTAPASLSASANTICAGNSTTLTVNGGSLGTNANWQWYENSCGGISAGSGVTISVSPATSKMFYARAEGTCNTTVCDSVFINVNSAPPAPATTDTTVCEGQAVPDLTATGNNIKWYADSALTQLLDTGNAFATGQTAAGIYSYYVNDSTGVCAGPASIAALTINSIPQAPNAFDATGCENGIIPNLTATGTSINWYDDAVMSNLLGIGNSFATGQTNAGNYTYYATETINGCESPADSATLTILSGIAAPAASDKSACEGTNIPSLSSSGSNVSWYSDPSLTTLVNTGNSFNTGQTAAGVYTYYVTDSLSGCASSADTATLTIIAAPPAPVGNDTSICYGQPVPDLNATGNNINWYNEPALIIWVGSGNSYSTGQTNVGNYSYYITQTVNGCTSISDTVTLVINPAPLVTVNPAVANISPGDSVVINAYNANSYTWSPPTGLNTTTGSTVIAKPTVTTTYTVTGDNGKGCSGSATVTINVWPVGINDNVSISQSLNIYPNPARTQLFLEFYSGKATAVDLNIVNSLGQNVIQKRLLPEKGFYSQVFDVHTLPAGVYHLQLSDGNEIISKRLVIQ